jgi:hypothetical protein
MCRDNGDSNDVLYAGLFRPNNDEYCVLAKDNEWRLRVSSLVILRGFFLGYVRVSFEVVSFEKVSFVAFAESKMEYQEIN